MESAEELGEVVEPGLVDPFLAIEDFVSEAGDPEAQEFADALGRVCSDPGDVQAAHFEGDGNGGFERVFARDAADDGEVGGVELEAFEQESDLCVCEQPGF